MSLFDRFKKNKDSGQRPRLIDLLVKPPSTRPHGQGPSPNPESHKQSLTNPSAAPLPPAYLRDLSAPAERTGSFPAVTSALRYDLYQVLRKEHATLTELGLPIPELTRDISFSSFPTDYEQGRSGYTYNVYLYFPTFSIPRVAWAVIRKKHDLPYISNFWKDEGVKKELFEPLANHVVFVVTGENALHTASNLAQHEIEGLIGSNAGAWINRDPYGLYKWFNGLPKLTLKSYVVESEDYWLRRYYDKNFSFDSWLLKCIPPETLPSLEGTRQRYAFHSGLMEGLSGYGAAHEVTRSTIRSSYTSTSDKHVLPPHSFPERHTTFKILPNQEVPLKQSRELFDQLHHYVRSPLAFELVSEKDRMYFQLACASADAEAVERQLTIHLPGFAVLPNTPPPDQSPQKLYVIEAWPRYSYAPIKRGNEFSLDPYEQLFAELQDGDSWECIQFLFAAITNAPINTVIESLGSRAGDHGARIKQLNEKKPAWFVGMRVFAAAEQRAHRLAEAFLPQYASGDQFIMESEARRVPRFRRKVEPWNVVSTTELAGLVHFPSSSIAHDRLETTSMKAVLPPDNYTTGGAVIGRCEARGDKKQVTLPAGVRDRHLYVVGKSGMGKSTLIANAVIANMHAGEGVCVIDPHGDLVESGPNPLIDYVLGHRVKDTIYFNAADKEYPLALNMLSAGKDEELSLLADNLLVMFRRQSDGWGPRMEDILRATLQTLMHTPGSTFLDIKRMLHSEAFRRSIVRRLNHPVLKEFWEEDYPASYSRKDAAAPIISRVNKFIYLPQLYAMLSSPESKLSFYDIIQSKKILLVNLSSGTIGEDNAQLLGSLIVTQLQMAAMRRAGVPPSQRHPFYLYVDEFQNFTTAPFEKILSEARKYKLCLTLAHQYISQISEAQRDAIFGNVGTMIMFSCGDRDAHALRYQLGSYEPQDLVNLRNFEALCRPESAKDTFPFKTTPPPEKPGGFAEAIIENTRMTYATIIDPDVQPETRERPVREAAPARPRAKPAKALDKNFATKGDEILFYVGQAEYLNTAQIKQLCYGHLVEAARAPAASRDLKKLIDAKRLKIDAAPGGNVYFTGRTPKASSHNLEVRNLLVKIIRTGLEIAEVSFCPQLPSLVPDLAVSFLTEDGGILKTFWEYDASTEGMAELMKKAARYALFKDEAVITFVFNSRSRLEQVNRSIKDNFIRYAVLDEIGTLHDPVFQYAGDGRTTPFF